MGRMPAPKSLADVIAANLKALAIHRGHVHRTGERAGKPSTVAMAAHSKVSQQQISRVLNARHAVTLDTLEALAKGYKVPVYSLVIPSLNPAQVPTLTSEALIEEEVEKRVEVRMAAIMAQMQAFRVKHVDQRPPASDPEPDREVPDRSKKDRAD